MLILLMYLLIIYLLSVISFTELLCLNGVAHRPSPCELNEWLFHVDDVRDIIFISLKKGKAAGAGNITAVRLF